MTRCNMKPSTDPVRRFDQISPIYNWLYPLTGVHTVEKKLFEPNIEKTHYESSVELVRRAIYVHIPFCETICNFCPLSKGLLRSEQELDYYVNALVKEIEFKAGCTTFQDIPIRAIFFGGGTPSMLNSAQIKRIGLALHSSYDLSNVVEFSVEMEAKSINESNANAFRSIGVTHARFGVQTFSQNHRHILNLTPTIEQIQRTAKLLTQTFDYVSCDMMYGYHGQSFDEFQRDIECAVDLGTTNLDFYPINTYVVQKQLLRAYKKMHAESISERTKIYMTQLLRDILYEKGFLPHNGHGFVKSKVQELEERPVISNNYSFVYHEHAYGTEFDEIIGFGSSAQSYMGGVTTTNKVSQKVYSKELIENSSLEQTHILHSQEINAAKSLCITLPYLGQIETSRIRWDLISDQNKKNLDELQYCKLIEVDEHQIRITADGWLWNTNIMFFLAPDEEKSAIAELILESNNVKASVHDITKLSAGS